MNRRPVPVERVLHLVQAHVKTAARAFCCAEFGAMISAAGLRGFSIVVTDGQPETDRPRFFLQMRVTDAGHWPTGLTSSYALTLRTEVVIDVCPWCGRHLHRFYARPPVPLHPEFLEREDMDLVRGTHRAAPQADSPAVFLGSFEDDMAWAEAHTYRGDACFCCTTLKTFMDQAGDRCIAIVAQRSTTKAQRYQFYLQMRAARIDQPFTCRASSLVTTVRTQTIRICPWCGRHLERFYSGKDLPEHPELLLEEETHAHALDHGSSMML